MSDLIDREADDNNPEDYNVRTRRIADLESQLAAKEAEVVRLGLELDKLRCALRPMDHDLPTDEVKK